MTLNNLSINTYGNDSTAKVLVIEDNRDLAENIVDYLELKGFNLDFTVDGVQGLHLASTNDYEVIVLDLMLPGMDGLTVCKRLRSTVKKNTPILMLTALNTLSDKLAGFKAGADDYMVKPFALPELAARLEAIIRRMHNGKTTRLKIANLELDTLTRKIAREGQKITLSKTCFKILEILMYAYPEVVTRTTIEQTIWGDMLPGSDSLRSHIYALRLEIDKPFKSSLIRTIHGIGYQLVEPNEIQE
jgi:DNA-binding response OmpR family regulator